jgi:hypothetical protein
MICVCMCVCVFVCGGGGGGGVCCVCVGVGGGGGGEVLQIFTAAPDEAIDLLSNLIRLDPRTRLSATQVSSSAIT